MIRFRFVSYANDLISLYEEAPWDHVEIVLPDGAGYLGAQPTGGVQIRQPGYDAPFKQEIFVDVPVSDEVANAFYGYGSAAIGTPYDKAAIVGYAIHDDALHTKGDVICSALCVILCEKSGVFPGKLSRKAHEIDPDNFLLVLSGRVAIPEAYRA